MSTAAGSVPTLAEALKRYLAEVTPAKAKTSQKERYMAAALAKKPIAAMPLDRITSSHISELLRELEQSGLSGTRIRLYLALLSHVYTVAARDWHYGGLQNPVKLARRPKPAPGRQRRLKPGERERLLKACDAWLRPVVEFALETAMRQGEIATLRWEHIDLGRRVAHLPLTKNGLARDVPLSARAMGIIRALPERADGLIFGAGDYSHAFAAACRRAGITDLRFHDLRHEATSRLFERGLSLPVRRHVKIPPRMSSETPPS